MRRLLCFARRPASGRRANAPRGAGAEPRSALGADRYAEAEPHLRPQIYQPTCYYRTGGGRSIILRRPTTLLLPTLLVLTLTSFACGDGGASLNKTTPTPRDPSAIRGLDLATNPAIQNTLRQLGSGEVAVREVVYVDLTGDGLEEAIVPITSNGTVGNIAYVVLTMPKTEPSVILTRRLERGSAGGLRMTVGMDSGRPVLIETAAEYGDEDPFCCPSVLRRTTFRWDGSQLQVEREEKTPAPPNPKTRGD